MSSRKRTSPLQRGLACLSCRKRKLKCDGTRPACRQCSKMNRDHLCEYDDKKQKSRTEKLREKLSMLEDRIRELESETPADTPLDAGASSSSSSPSASSSIQGSPQMELQPSQLYIRTKDLGPFDQTSFSSFDNSSWSGSASDVPPLALASFNNNDEWWNSLVNGGSVPSSTTTPQERSPAWDIPTDIKGILLESFAMHKHQCWFDADMTRFAHGVGYDTPHPALMNAIYLLGCHFSGSSFTSSSSVDLEGSLFAAALYEITQALDSSDRLVDIVHASCMLAVYLYDKGRALEAYCHAFSAARLAVALGLHQLRPPDYLSDFSAIDRPASSTIPLVAARNRTEQRDRMAAFWQVFMVDRCWSTATGLPIALPDGDSYQARIKTSWLKSPLDVDVDEWPETSTPRALFEEGGSLLGFNLHPPHVPALRAKAAALYERTSRLSSSWTKVSDTYTTEYAAAQTALLSFTATLPPFLGYESWRQQAPFIDVELFMVHTVAHVCMINLRQGAMDNSAFQAANHVLSFIRQLQEDDYPFLEPIISICWYAVAKMYMRTICSLRAEEITKGLGPCTPSILSQEIGILLHAIKTLGVYFPVAAEQAKRIGDEYAHLGAAVA
ncbi:hypothetical protein FISHEDRAFT_73825 [Fistulina hepatica ATCC 64428]|uniref:Zn(2)-C6 fungal-type domain-containing protein n=1 Tax=Fistulina hepatica ATCC 64428 TaxID=1128425 RepID=A0A0D7ABN3_9AGAR|nr:hypothetical protein FISHEDRAFT_73825 [Fistulina hepatica ATCC 64428]